MQDLKLIGVQEDGEHLLLSGAGDALFRMPIDEALRAAVRRDRPHLGQQPVEVDGGLRPRDVQAMIRAGASTDEAASRAGWSVEKVRRYEGPILAEREHVAALAQKARLRTRSGASAGGTSNAGPPPTLSARVAERLESRGVTATDAGWDSWRAEGGTWTVVLTFAAGGRQRQASWSFDLADRTVSALDDEARWLSEEVQADKGPIPRASAVYDVEADGGLQPAARIEHQDDPVDLMTAMRKRSAARSRRRSDGHRGSGKAAASVPNAADQASEHPENSEHSEHSQHSEQVLPLDNLALDPETVSPDEGLESGESAEPQGHPKAPAARRPREAASRTGRPSVPAWDEIMFGSRPVSDLSDLSDP